MITPQFQVGFRLHTTVPSLPLPAFTAHSPWPPTSSLPLFCAPLLALTHFISFGFFFQYLFFFFFGHNTHTHTRGGGRVDPLDRTHLGLLFLAQNFQFCGLLSPCVVTAPSRCMFPLLTVDFALSSLDNDCNLLQLLSPVETVFPLCLCICFFFLRWTTSHSPWFLLS